MFLCAVKHKEARFLAPLDKEEGIDSNSAILNQANFTTMLDLHGEMVSVTIPLGNIFSVFKAPIKEFLVPALNTLKDLALSSLGLGYLSSWTDLNKAVDYIIDSTSGQ